MADFLLGGTGDRAGGYPGVVSANHTPRRRHLRRPGLLAASGLALATGVTVARAVGRLEIVGESMRPTLEPGDRVLVLRFLPVRVGDLVALADPRQEDRIVVKRVADLHGGRFTVLGDNPDASTDSRHFGPVAREAIAGRVVYRYAPPSRQAFIVNSPNSHSFA